MSIEKSRRGATERREVVEGKGVSGRRREALGGSGRTGPLVMEGSWVVEGQGGGTPLKEGGGGALEGTRLGILNRGIRILRRWFRDVTGRRRKARRNGRREGRER